uniref:Uncharacterized protein n=1 Tax=Sus scrofa TaxID=9823 RepID=A0A4X1SUF2_PIG
LGEEEYQAALAQVKDTCFYAFTVRNLAGYELISINKRRGKPLLGNKVADLEGKDLCDSTQPTELQRKLLSQSIVVLEFPLCQFHHDGNSENKLVLNNLKLAQPQGGPQPLFWYFPKCSKNDCLEHPLSTFSKNWIPTPEDIKTTQAVDPGFPDLSLICLSKFLWSNLERFLNGPDLVKIRRLNQRYTFNIAPQNEGLLTNEP